MNDPSLLQTTFLQTFVLWFLVYLTLFIDIADFDNRFMGAITGFLVFASLLSSIIASLPKSSSMKLADIWLLFFMINIIFVIVLHIFIEYRKRSTSEAKTTPEKMHWTKENISPISVRTNNISKVVLPIVVIIFLIVFAALSSMRIT